MSPIKLLFAASLALWLTGCSTQEAGSARCYTLHFPKVSLQPQEYIQYVQVDVPAGRVIALNHIIHDWRASIGWEGGLNLEAGHFSSGLDDVHDLDGLIVVELDGGKSAAKNLKVELHTESTDPTGRGPRVLVLQGAELSLEPTAVRKSAYPRW